MTIAIGTYCSGGLIVCADSNVVFQDGTVTTGYKLSACECENGSYVIANAGNDGNAASMLASEILSALSKSSTDRWNIEPTIKEQMKAWHSGYTQGTPPQMEFILAARTGRQNRSLYFCEAPNTVLRKHLNESIAIGSGSQIVDPLLSDVILGPADMRTALLRAAYLMYRAKKDHVYCKGSQTDAMVISAATGEVRPVSQEEMGDAEKLGPEVDVLLRYCYLGVLGQSQGSDREEFMKAFKENYLELKERADAISFPSLDGL